MIYLCSILLLPSLLIPFDSFICHLLNQLFCETKPEFNISSNGPELLIKMQHLVTCATHIDVFKKPKPNIFGINTLGPQPTDLVESSMNW